LEILPSLGKRWRWEVVATDVEGQRLPVTIVPTRSWFFAGGALRSPAGEIGFAAASVIGAYVVQMVWGPSAQNVFLGALLAFGVITLRNGLAAILRLASKGGGERYRFRGDNDD
jgi:hypothetical protein